MTDRMIAVFPPQYFVSNGRDLHDNLGHRLLPNSPGGEVSR
jgi:hypothetical protein